MTKSYISHHSYWSQRHCWRDWSHRSRSQRLCYPWTDVPVAGCGEAPGPAAPAPGTDARAPEPHPRTLAPDLRIRRSRGKALARPRSSLPTLHTTHRLLQIPPAIYKSIFLIPTCVPTAKYDGVRTLRTPIASC